MPEGPSAGVVICVPYVAEGEDAEMDVNFGIDPQVVADSINEKLGPLGSITAGSVSGGSVEMGATVLGSLGGGSQFGGGSGFGSGPAEDSEENGEVGAEAVG